MLELVKNITIQQSKGKAKEINIEEATTKECTENIEYQINLLNF